MTLSFEKKLFPKLAKYKNKKLLVAYSGGKDSTALLHYVYTHRDNYGYTLMPAYINHNIREDVTFDVSHCNNFCKKIGLPLIIKSVDTKKYMSKEKTSIEESARILRYEALHDIRKKYSCDYILTAHNFNDLIENFFIKIFRGTSIFRLKGFNNSHIIDRPMLSIDVAEILEYLHKHKLTFITDKTNFEDNYLRNWVRGTLIKNIEEKDISFLHKISIIQDESELLSEYMAKNIKLPYEINNGVIKILKDKFLDLDDVERRYYLSQLIPLHISKNILKEIDKILWAKDSKRINLQGGYIFEKSFKYIYIFKKEIIDYFNIYKEENNKTVEISHLKKTIQFGDYLKERRLIVRNRRAGDRLFGKKLKDLFINKKIDLFDRDTSVIVEDHGGILWVEHVCDDKSVQVKEL